MKRNIIGRVATVTALVASVIVARPASAQYELNIAGSVNVSNSPFNAADVLLDFSQFVQAIDNTSLPGISSFPSDGIGTIGTINDLILGEPLLGRPLCVNCPVSPFLTIGGYVFTLQNTPAATGGAVTFGPVALNPTQNGTSAQFSGNGTVTGGIFGAGVRNFSVTFNATFTGVSPAALVADINGGGTRNVTFGADFLISAIPEPATVALMGTGLVALFGLGLRRRMNV